MTVLSEHSSGIEMGKVATKNLASVPHRQPPDESKKNLNSGCPAAKLESTCILSKQSLWCELRSKAEYEDILIFFLQIVGLSFRV